MKTILKKGIMQVLIPFVLICIVLTSLAYVGLYYYYQAHLPYGLWVNDIYCTGYSLEEANDALQQIPYEAFIVVHGLEGELEVAYSDYVVQQDYIGDIKDNMGIFQMFELFEERHLEVTPDITLNTAQISTYLSDCSLFQNEEEAYVSIIETIEGFVLLDTTKERIDTKKAITTVIHAIESGAEEVSLVDAGCYYDEPYTDEQRQTMALYDRYDAFTHTINFDLYIGKERYPIDAGVLMKWMKKDANGEYSVGKDGSFILDPKLVKAFTTEFYQKVSTRSNKDFQWDFINHDGEEVKVNVGTYGRVLDANALYKYLLNAFETGESVDYELSFTYYPKSAKDADYGFVIPDTYLEVDLKQQHLYLYEDGELILDSACVTGDVRRNRETPDGMYYINYMQRGRTLVGENYRTYVSYWMHFYSQCGFHDAAWRSAFGDDIYEYDGSHGCVNMPKDKAKELFELAYVGVPVVVY